MALVPASGGPPPVFSDALVPWGGSGGALGDPVERKLERLRADREAHQHKQLWTKDPHGGPYRKARWREGGVRVAAAAAAAGCSCRCPSTTAPLPLRSSRSTLARAMTLWFSFPTARNARWAGPCQHGRRWQGSRKSKGLRGGRTQAAPPPGRPGLPPIMRLLPRAPAPHPHACDAKHVTSQLPAPSPTPTPP